VLKPRPAPADSGDDPTICCAPALSEMSAVVRLTISSRPSVTD
jgi:hypothetical protein